MTETMEYDIVIVGAGPSGLSAAIRLRQLSLAAGKDIRVCILEKGSEVGAHIMSGAVLEPRSLNELIPDWKEKGAPVTTAVTTDEFLFLTKKYAVRLPTPPSLHNKGNYIISLSNLCRWLAQQAEGLGVEIFPGFPAADVIIENGEVKGVVTGEFGRGKDGEKKPSYQPGIEIRGTYTFFAEGCRGSLSQKLMQQFNLRDRVEPQTYGLGIKEVWEIDPAKHRKGVVTHSVGWPLDSETYGGSFIYHMENNLVSAGFITGLDYRNPYISPFEEFQRFKTHPAIAPLFVGGKRISYGARAINEGGFQSIPGLAFPGGVLIGCSAGFLNVAKIKGTHTAMKTGMLAAEAAFTALLSPSPLEREGRGGGYTPHETSSTNIVGTPLPNPPAQGGRELTAYTQSVKQSWVYEELRRVRNIRPGFRHNIFTGLINAAFETYISGGDSPWTLKFHADHTRLRKACHSKKIHYPKADGMLTFDRLSSVFLSSTNHEEDQPSHLTLKDAAIPVTLNYNIYAGPEQLYCPAGVYEFVGEGASVHLQINAQNCVHCKTCDIKDPAQNIVWVTPEGGGGPNYSGM